MIWGSKHLAKSEHHSLQLLPGYKPEIIYFLWKLRRCCNIIAVFFQTLFFISEGFHFNNEKVQRINLPVTILIKNFERCSDISRRFIFHHFLLHHHLFNVFIQAAPSPPQKSWQQNFDGWIGKLDFWTNLGHPGYLGPFATFLGHPAFWVVLQYLISLRLTDSGRGVAIHNPLGTTLCP